MTDLFLLRELIKNEQAVSRREDIPSVFRRCKFDGLFGSIAVRGSLPYSPVAIASFFDLLAVKAIQSPSRIPTSAKFRSWYTERLRVTLPIDVEVTKCRAFTIAMGRTHALAIRSVNQLRVPGEGELSAQSMRPLPLVLRGTLTRVRNANSTETQKRGDRHSTGPSKSHRTTYTSHSSAPSPSSGTSRLGFHLGSTQSLTLRQASAPQPEEASDEDLFLRANKRQRNWVRKNTLLGDSLKNEVLELANEFTDVSSLIQSTELASLTREKTSIL